MCHNSRERNACCSTIHVVHPQSVSLSLWVSLPGRDHHRIVGEVPFSALAENSRPEVATSVTPSLLSSKKVRSIGSHGLRDRGTWTDERAWLHAFASLEEEEEEEEEVEVEEEEEGHEEK
uniref:Uncharacterized protein n=1 Tax=Vespula pensylvanica TaxID=30213 RepID=A0A834NYB6_VESPE|nr:hypothetical protein H0235_009325 [Vespula pensylvanica]